MIINMLSRVITKSLTRAFSTANTPAVRSSVGTSLLDRAGVSEGELTTASQGDLREIESVVQSERKHLAYYANDVREQLNDRTNINFEQQTNGKTLIFESLPDGTSNSKLAEILLLASAANLWNLLLGFPSYLALGGTLGVAGLGAVWSYSNYLRRKAPQITEVYRTAEGKLEVHYLKPGWVGRTGGSFTVESSSYQQVSFDGSVNNYIRKTNRTAWVQIDGKLFWFGNNDHARANNHHLL